MAHDWGHLVRQGIETFTGIGMSPVQQFIGGPVAAPSPGLVIDSDGIRSGGGGGGGGGNVLCPPAGSCGGPRYLTYDCKTGQMSVRRRKRRGKLLTAGRKEDLAFVIAVFGKGAAAQIALAKAMGS